MSLASCRRSNHPKRTSTAGGDATASESDLSGHATGIGRCLWIYFAEHGPPVHEEQALQGRFLDRLLKDRYILESRLDALGAIARNEYKRHVARYKSFSQRIDCLAFKIGDWVIYNTLDGRGGRLLSRLYKRGRDANLRPYSVEQIRALTHKINGLARDFAIFSFRESPGSLPALTVLKEFNRRLQKYREKVQAR
jgi:hypothetical protein